MPLSQFKLYTASDPQGPGYLTGLTGSLISILDACLVDGYGTGSYYKAPAGWTKPVPNSGSGTQICYGGWRQGGGSSMSLFINDSGTDSAALGKECTATGWETLTTTHPTGSTPATNVGGGLGQFPLPAQEFTYGHVVIRKSTSADSSPRYWMMYADATTFYFWMITGDYTGVYHHWMFGDCYSLRPSGDNWKCCIYGRCSTNNPYDQSRNDYNDYDYTCVLPASVAQSVGGYMSVRQPCHYIARTCFGSNQSIAICKGGDQSISNGYTYQLIGTSMSNRMEGCLQGPNIDNKIHLVPLKVVEPGSPAVYRGRFRGLYQVGHFQSAFTDGQIISGSLDFPDKVFSIVRPGLAYALWAVEISPTVETN